LIDVSFFENSWRSSLSAFDFGANHVCILFETEETILVCVIFRHEFVNGL
jgi:hypothetical protein